MNTPNRHTPDPWPDATPDRGYLSEMFCSIQGEGPFVGERHVFVRTAGCTAACNWCDTVYSKVLTPRFVIHEGDPGTAEAKRPLDNPVHIDDAVDEVVAFAARHRPVDAVSLTGGEPLEQPGFAVALARRLHAADLRLYLETNGVHGAALSQILPYVGVIAMDIKLPSAVGLELWDAHREFLSVVAGTDFVAGKGTGRTLFVKIVMDARSRLDEVDRAVALIAAVSPSIPLVLQPESETLLSPRTPRETAAAMMAAIESAQRSARSRLECVRVMPQLHKIMKVR
jgi:organic radical activating enzyme